MGTDLALTRLLQLASPALPVGAYSYSQGLEAAVEAGIVHDAASAGRWIGEHLITTFLPSDTRKDFGSEIRFFSSRLCSYSPIYIGFYHSSPRNTSVSRFPTFSH